MMPAEQEPENDPVSDALPAAPSPAGTPAEDAQFGERLRSFREKMGLKQADIAKMANIASETYARLERGYSLPRIETLKDLARIFSTSTDALVGLDKEKNFEVEALSADLRRLIKAARKLGPRELNLTAQLAEELGRKSVNEGREPIDGAIDGAIDSAIDGAIDSAIDGAIAAQSGTPHWDRLREPLIDGKKAPIKKAPTKKAPTKVRT